MTAKVLIGIEHDVELEKRIPVRTNRMTGTISRLIR